MYRRTHRLIATCFATIAMASLAAAADPEATGAAINSVVAAAPAKDGAAVQVIELHPFTNIAYVPAGADLSSIRFEGVKTVKVATKRTITRPHFCEEGFQEPAGSMFCPYSRDDSPEPAYQISYSFEGPPLASDDSGNRRFVFSVYLNPDELSPTVRRAVTAGRTSKADSAAFLRVTASQGFVQQLVIDEASSAFCDGGYIDGLWTHKNPDCEDKPAYKMVATPSNYLTVKVDPAARRSEGASAYRIGSLPDID